MPDEKILSIPWSEFGANLHLSREIASFLETVRRLAEEEGLFLYIAGGPVRDFLLKRPVKDIDLVLEGDWERLLERLFAETGAKLLMKSQFLTYKVLVGMTTIDLATSRREHYPEPAVLPQVSPAGLEEDVYRRDFTINALVYGLTPPYREKIVDLVGGLEDIRRGLIRPLHERSFVDDPTRILRGIRYKVRLSFDYGAEFFNALRLAEQVSSPRKLSSSRLSQELLNFVKKEPFWLLHKFIEELRDLEIFKKFGLKERTFDQEDLAHLLRAKEELSEKEFQKLFLLYLVELEAGNMERLGFSRKEREFMETQRKRIEEIAEKDTDILQKVEVLDRIPLYLLYRFLLEEKLRDLVGTYLNTWRFIRPSIGGKDLKSLGISEGKRIGEILREIRRMKLQGLLRSSEEELAFAKSLIFSKN